MRPTVPGPPVACGREFLVGQLDGLVAAAEAVEGEGLERAPRPEGGVHPSPEMRRELVGERYGLHTAPSAISSSSWPRRQAWAPSLSG